MAKRSDKTFRKGREVVTTSSPVEQVRLKASGFVEDEPKKKPEPAPKQPAKTADDK